MASVSSDGSGADQDVDQDLDNLTDEAGGHGGEGGADSGAAASEKQAVLRGEEVDLPDERTLHEYFEATVRSQRDGASVADLPALVNMAADSAPSAEAPDSGGSVLTFGQVNVYANQIARQLRNQLLLSASSSPTSSRSSSFEHPDASRQQPIVAIWMPPSEYRIVTMLALWKLGAVVLVLDHSLPDHRILAMCEENRPFGVVVSSQDPDYRQRIQNIFRRTKFHLMDYESILLIIQQGSGEQGQNNLSKDETLIVQNGQLQPNSVEVDSSSDRIAVIIYTSGSTGLNKGVCLSHRNLLNRLYWQWVELAYRPGDCCVSKTSILFVDFLTETFGPLLEAVRVVIADRATTGDIRKLLPLIDRQRVTRLVLVPSLLDAIVSYLASLRSGHYLKNLKLIITSGEALSQALAMRFFDKLPHCTLANFYGSTEVTGDVTFQLFHSKEEVERYTVNYKLSIGCPIYNTNIYLLVDNNSETSSGHNYQLCTSPGQLGAIYVSGCNVAARYVSTAGDTNVDAFVRNPFLSSTLPSANNSSQNHAVLYRTGDYGRIVNGQLIFEDRRDGVVKMRGQKVSLAELERAITTQFPQISGQVVVQVVNNNNNGNNNTSNIQLVAFYAIPPAPGASSTAASSSPSLKPSDIVAKTRKYMPDYVQFDAFAVQTLPLQQHTGKIDRRQLAQMFQESQQKSANKIAIQPSAASNAVARALSLASVDQLDGAKSFFEMGGNSLSSVLAIAYLQQAGYQTADLERLLGSKSLYDFLQTLAPPTNNPSSTNSPNRPPPPPRPAVGPRTSIPVSSTYGRYKLVKLGDVQAERHTEIIDIIADAFTTANPLEVINATTKETFATVIRLQWKDFLADGLSLICFDTQTVDGQPSAVGAAIALDMATAAPFDESSYSGLPEHALRIIDEVEAPVKAELVKRGGRFADMKYLAVSSSVRSPIERAIILNAMETEIVRLVKSLTFDGIITVSSHAATQEMEEKIYGYLVRNTLHVNSYRWQQQQPFKHAPEDYYLKCLVKMLKQ